MLTTLPSPTVGTPPPLIPLREIVKKQIAHRIAGVQFAPFIGAISRPWLAAMHDEARNQLKDAVKAEQTEGLCYKAELTGLGPIAINFLEHFDVKALLKTNFGDIYELSKHLSCLTSYRAHDHLGAHLDEPEEECSVTIILYLEAESPKPNALDTGLMLNIYGTEKHSIGRPRLQIPTLAGTLILGRGSRVWHERPKLQDGEHVIAITGCYRPIR